MTTFVLVHGGFAEGTVWRDTRDSLEARGHRVLVAELPSTGPDPLALGGPADDAAEVRRLLDSAGESAVLVGHSSSGVVLTEVADHPGIARTVYLAAMWPTRGQVLADVLGTEPLDWQEVHPSGTALTVTPDSEISRRALAVEVEPERWARCHAGLVASAVSVLTTPAREPERSHPTTYVVCTRDAVLPPDVQEMMAARADAVLRIDTAHMPQIAEPEGLALVLERAAAGADERAASGGPGVSERSS